MPRGYDPYEEAALKSVFQNAFGRPFDDAQDVQETWKNPEYYADTAIGSTASIIPDGYGDDGSSDYGPAPLTETPTSSSNADRPRTLAAGYQLYPGTSEVPFEGRKGKLTVMFRDGTLYNFYDVTPEEWVKFKGSLSKGTHLNWKPTEGFLLRKPHGPADLSNVSAATQSLIQRLSREAQVNYRYSGNQGRYKGSITPTAAKRARREMGLSSRSARPGVNPARNRGKNPK